MVTISCPAGFLYEKTGGVYSPAASTYKACEVSGRQFFLHGASLAQAETLRVEHTASGAVDEIRFSSCEMCFVTPSGDPGERAQERDSGDGQNEFTFDDASEQLRVNLKVRISADASNSSEVTGHFSMPAIGGTTLSWVDNNGNTGNPKATKAGEDWIFEAVACYNGYPFHNSDFGRKTVIFEMGGSSIDTDFEVFFPSDGHNHPACSTCANCPNWFYYWREGQVCEIPNGVVYKEGTEETVAGAFDPRTKVISLSSLAPQPCSQIPACEYGYEFVTIDPGFVEIEGVLYPVGEPVVVSNRVAKRTFFVGVDGSGIRAVAATVKHESCHKSIDASFPDDIQVIFDEDESASVDYDCDTVLDADEKTGRWGIITEVGIQDTYDMGAYHSAYTQYGDNEIQARVSEASDIDNSYHCDQDWCNPGCQSKVRRGPTRE